MITESHHQVLSLMQEKEVDMTSREICIAIHGTYDNGHIERINSIMSWLHRGHGFVDKLSTRAPSKYYPSKWRLTEAGLHALEQCGSYDDRIKDGSIDVLLAEELSLRSLINFHFEGITEILKHEKSATTYLTNNSLRSLLRNGITEKQGIKGRAGTYLFLTPNAQRIYDKIEEENNECS